jgi:hypothetical protein
MLVFVFDNSCPACVSAGPVSIGTTTSQQSNE